jgi:septum formation protein
VSSFEETLPHDQYTAPDYARHTATHKALDVAQQLRVASASAASGSDGSGSGVAAPPPPFLVIGADTVVEYGDLILEKPADAEDAARMLRMLSGKRHHVHTGVALVLPLAREEVAAAAGARPAAGAVRSAADELAAWRLGVAVGYS